MNDIVTTTGNQVASLSEPATASLLNMIAASITNPDVDAGKLNGLLDFQQRVIAMQAEAAFNRDFTALEAVLPRIKKNGAVEYPTDKNKPDGPKKKAFAFAKFEDIDAIVRPLMRSHGFSVSFDSASREGGGLVVTGKLRHQAGHSESASVPLATDASGGKNNLQGIGSSISYGKRYALTMLLNLVFEGEDDDGERGGTVFVNDDQLKQMQNLAEETGSNVEKFCGVMGVESLPFVKASDFAKAMNLLNRKKAKGATP